MNGPKVYADLTFLINLIMDFVILWATGRFAGIKIVYYRICLASILGGIYAVGFLYPEMDNWYSFPMKIIFSCLLIIFALRPANWNEFKKSFLFFYCISFVVAGATIATSYLFKTSTQAVSFTHICLLGGIAVAIFTVVYGEKYLTQIIPGLLKFNVELRFDHNVCNGKGFLDTGNGLRDPLTNRPVVIAEYGMLKDCFPEDLKTAMENSFDEASMLEQISNSTWAHRLRLIPFSSIGKQNGILVGIRADEIILDTGKQNIFHKNLVVGIYKEKLSSDGSYHLLIPSEIVQKG